MNLVIEFDSHVHKAISEVSASSADERRAAKIVVHLKSALERIPGGQYIRNRI